MKNFLLTIFTVCMFMLNISNAQLLFNEDFNFNSGDTLSKKGWIQVPTVATNPLKCAGPGLIYNGYSGSGTGASAFIDSTGQDIYKNAASSVNSGSIYAAFMMNDSVAKPTGDYFFALLPQSSTSLYTARVYIKLISGGYYKIAVMKGATTLETIFYSTDSFALKTTYLCVVKYQFNPGTTNDSLKIFMFASGFPSAEPALATVATIGGTNTDATDLGRIALRQGTNSSAPKLYIDGIHVATSWANLNATILNPSPVSGITSTPTTTTATLNWIKPPGYNNSTMTTLLFLKSTSAVTQGTPNAAINNYTANSDFTLSNSLYQNDAAAHCIFTGDTNTLIVTGLLPNTSYYVLAYVVRDADSTYSGGASIKIQTTSAGPGPVNSVSFIANGQTSATIRWTHDTSYRTALHTTLVYLKQASAIIQGSPSTSPVQVIPNPVFMSGSLYQNDSGAYSIYKGDSNAVSVSGLLSGTTYYILVYAVTDSDSAYSIASTGIGSTLFPAPIPVTGILFTGTSTTAATIEWTKPGGYVNSAYTTLVFVKQTSAIAAGTPTKTISYYTGFPFFGFGTKYQNDASAYCVYKGDTDIVNITNINNSAPYYVLIYVVRDADSTYTSGATGSGNALPPLPPPPFYMIGQINATNSTTGNPDSIGVRVGLRGIVYGFNHPQVGGVQFLMRDHTGGITVLSNNPFGYAVKEGDSIMVSGIVSSARGLVIVTTLDTLKRTDSLKQIKIPVRVPTLNEASENDLVRLDSVQLVPTTDTSWISNKTYSIITSIHDTVGIRIYSGSSLAGKHIPPPAVKFSVIGLGSQTSTSAVAPFAFNGYFIIPRKPADIVSIDSIHAGLREIKSLPDMNLFPNPFNNEITIQFVSAITGTATFEVMDLLGKIQHITTEKIIEDDHQIRLNMQQLNSGIYFLRVNMNGEVFIQKIIKN